MYDANMKWCMLHKIWSMWSETKLKCRHTQVRISSHATSATRLTKSLYLSSRLHKETCGFYNWIESLRMPQMFIWHRFTIFHVIQFNSGKKTFLRFAHHLRSIQTAVLIVNNDTSIETTSQQSVCSFRKIILFVAQIVYHICSKTTTTTTTIEYVRCVSQRNTR